MRAVLLTVALALVPASARADDSRALHGALGAYLTAAFFDAAGTAYCSGAGTCHEVNPVLRPVVDRAGVVPAMTAKGAMHVGIAWWLLATHRDHPRRTLWVALGLTAAQVAVNVINYRTGALR